MITLAEIRNRQKTAALKKEIKDLNQSQEDDIQVLWRTTLEKDLDNLKGLNLQQKKTTKLRLLKEYNGIVDDFLQDKNDLDFVFSWFTVWLWDAGLTEQFIDYAEIAIEKELLLPERFKSTGSFELFLLYKMEEHAALKGFDDGFFSKVYEKIPDVTQLPGDLPRKLLTHRFKQFCAAGQTGAAIEVGEQALEFGAKIKTKMERLQS